MADTNSIVYDTVTPPGQLNVQICARAKPKMDFQGTRLPKSGTLSPAPPPGPQGLAPPKQFDTCW